VSSPRSDPPQDRYEGSAEALTGSVAGPQSQRLRGPHKAPRLTKGKSPGCRSRGSFVSWLVEEFTHLNYVAAFRATSLADRLFRARSKDRCIGWSAPAPAVTLTVQTRRAAPCSNFTTNHVPPGSGAWRRPRNGGRNCHRRLAGQGRPGEARDSRADRLSRLIPRRQETLGPSEPGVGAAWSERRDRPWLPANERNDPSETARS
jgi:hypothetical protein